MASPQPDRRRRNVTTGVEGAAVGAGLSQGGYQSAGYKAKHVADAKTRKGYKGVTPEQVKMQDKALKPLKRANGMHLPNGHPDRNNVAYHRNYPKGLPMSRTIRTLGHTHEGRLGVAVGTAATIGGALAGVGTVHHIRKSAFGVDHSESVEKSEARMGLKAAEWTGHLPKHTPGAIAANKSAFKASIENPNLPRPVKPGLTKTKPRFTKVAKLGPRTPTSDWAGESGTRNIQRGIQQRADARMEPDAAKRSRMLANGSGLEATTKKVKTISAVARRAVRKSDTVSAFGIEH